VSATSVAFAGSATAAVPGPPTDVTARAGDQLAEATWSAPAPDDPSIAGYTITTSPSDTPAVIVDPTARTATVTGLTNGTAYSFTVAATKRRVRAGPQHWRGRPSTGRLETGCR